MKNFPSSSLWFIKTFTDLDGAYNAFAIGRLPLPESSLKALPSSMSLMEHTGCYLTSHHWSVASLLPPYSIPWQSIFITNWCSEGSIDPFDRRGFPSQNYGVGLLKTLSHLWRLPAFVLLPARSWHVCCSPQHWVFCEFSGSCWSRQAWHELCIIV